MAKIIDREYIEQSIRAELAKWQEGSMAAAGDRLQSEEEGSDSNINPSLLNEANHNVRKDCVSTSRPLTEREVQRFEEAIVNGIIEGHTIDELARSCCYSLSTFKRRFSEQYTIPPHRWMLQCRLNLACEILAQTNEPISSVSEICGFVNNSHFIATFRRHYGLTPRQYRTNEKRD